MIEQYPVTDGKIVPVPRRGRTGRGHRRGRPLRADYVLEIETGFPVAVVEAKREYKLPGDGLQQGMRYAQMLDLPFAYATNGKGIVEHDYDSGLERDVADFPAPDELWRRYRTWKGVVDDAVADALLLPFNRDLRLPDGRVKEPRYYQRVAIERTLHAILNERRTRVLLTLATGTGKTFLALQIVWKLWSSEWRTARKPRVLYLADRNILVDQPIAREFQPVFGDAIWKIRGEAKTGREIYFALYQTLADSGEALGVFRDYPPDYFDLIVVDECHRGSARDESDWHAILEHFSPAVQVGMTATPKRDANVDTYNYFGDPIYTYSLAQDAEHASQMRQALNNANADLVRQYPNYAVRIVSDEGDTGRLHLGDFADPERETPVIATTAQLLSTGVDLPTVRNIVLFKPIGSIVEFKQIIGRGTRLYPDEDKLTFEIIDYSGATALFEDPEFDGPPETLPIVEEIDEEGKAVGGGEISEPEPAYGEQSGDRELDQDGLEDAGTRKFYVDEGAAAYVAAEGIYLPDPQSGRLLLVEYSDYVADEVRRLYPSAGALRDAWRTKPGRQEIIEALAHRGISMEEAADRLGLSDMDAVDLLVHVAWNGPNITRGQRVRRLRTEHREFFEAFVPQARSVLDDLLDKYAEHGISQLEDLRVLEVPPLDRYGSVVDIATRFGGSQKLRSAITAMEEMLYAA